MDRGDQMDVATTPRRRGRPVDADSEETRRRCIAEAIHVFATEGYARAGMRVIAEKVGITAPALYHHFPSKASLYGAAWVAAMDAVYAAYERAAATADDLNGELRAVMESARRMIREHGEIPKLVLVAALDTRRVDLQEHLSPPPSVWAFLDAVTARAVARGEIEHADRRRLQAFVTTQLWGIAAVSCYDPQALDAAVDAARWTIDARFPRRQA
jgi:AcrR family transcriptional regulator